MNDMTDTTGDSQGSRVSRDGPPRARHMSAGPKDSYQNMDRQSQTQMNKNVRRARLPRRGTPLRVRARERPHYWLGSGASRSVRRLYFSWSQAMLILTKSHGRSARQKFWASGRACWRTKCVLPRRSCSSFVSTLAAVDGDRE
jgi:hypothetical protein